MPLRAVECGRPIGRFHTPPDSASRSLCARSRIQSLGQAMASDRRTPGYSQSVLSELIRRESERNAGVGIKPGRQYGFFTDTTLCIGCKACEVACKAWNALPPERDPLGSGLTANTWRHVALVKTVAHDTSDTLVGSPAQSHWLMISDVCKHCDNAPCLKACPTGTLFRTEFDTVVVQQDVCSGCGNCVPACPFGVVDISEFDGKAHECTLCHDRLKGGLEPACAMACPTDSIEFGGLSKLHQRVSERVGWLHDQGATNAYLHGLLLASLNGPVSVAASLLLLSHGVLMRDVILKAGHAFVRRSVD